MQGGVSHCIAVWLVEGYCSEQRKKSAIRSVLQPVSGKLTQKNLHRKKCCTIEGVARTPDLLTMRKIYHK